MTIFATVPALARAAILSLLSRLFLQEVDPKLLRHLRQEELASSLEELASGVRAELQAASESEAARETLDVEYCRLFVLPTGVSPYASAWMDGDAAAARVAFQERMTSTLDVLGLRPQRAETGSPPSDHIGVVLALAAVALERAPEGDLADAALDLLRPWVHTFAARLEAETSSPLYRAGARLLQQVVAGPAEGQSQAYDGNV